MGQTFRSNLIKHLLKSLLLKIVSIQDKCWIIKNSNNISRLKNKKENSLRARNKREFQW